MRRRRDSWSIVGLAGSSGHEHTPNSPGSRRLGSANPGGRGAGALTRNSPAFAKFSTFAPALWTNALLSPTGETEGGRPEPRAIHRPALTILLNLANTGPHSPRRMPEEALLDKTGNPRIPRPKSPNSG